jgi:hypothetical protein
MRRGKQMVTRARPVDSSEQDEEGRAVIEGHNKSVAGQERANQWREIEKWWYGEHPPNNKQ